MNSLHDDSPRALLRIYLNDHLAAAAGGIRLARRVERSNRGTELGTYLKTFAEELEDDRQQLEEAIHRAEVPVNNVKRTAMVVAEIAGRVKPNGRLRGYSALSRLVELEALIAGVVMRKGLWQTLRNRPNFAVLPDDDLVRCIERAERQQCDLESHRLAAAAEAFGNGAEINQPAPARA